MGCHPGTPLPACHAEVPPFAEGASVDCREGRAAKGISRILALQEVEVWDRGRVRDWVSVPGGTATLCILGVNAGQRWYD